jgi:hypothetical protein
VLVNRNSSVSRKTLVTRLSELVQEEPKLWQGKSTKTPPNTQPTQVKKAAAKAKTSRR